MLLSMTGFGESHFQSPDRVLHIEVRAVNNRYLKVSVRGTEPYPMLEPELERIVRKYVRRGTVTANIRCERVSQSCEFKLNTQGLRRYLEQIREVCSADPALERYESALATGVLGLPGVATEPGAHVGRPDETEFAQVEQALEAALRQLHAMREHEGHAMAQELLGMRERIGTELTAINRVVPATIQAYRERLRSRIAQAFAEHNVAARPEDLLREVALFAERSDVTEEIIRLESHLDQFAKIVKNESDAPGRKLEFLVQEMGREANTIGSKAGDVSVSRSVVEIKATLEKIRELVQNVE